MSRGLCLFKWLLNKDVNHQHQVMKQ
uniref:Putative disease resistance protein RGA3 n=1 Tax=Rhizophora mucronata TaxID=61149 RepID=A0A2P2IHT3_RHIMU